MSDETAMTTAQELTNATKHAVQSMNRGRILYEVWLSSEEMATLRKYGEHFQDGVINAIARLLELESPTKKRKVEQIVSFLHSNPDVLEEMRELVTSLQEVHDLNAEANKMRTKVVELECAMKRKLEGGE